jgi:hypothetical protein
MRASDQIGAALAWMALVPVLGLAADIVAQLILCRVRSSGGHLRNQFISFGAGLASAAATLLFFLSRADVGWPDLIGYFTLYLMTYAFLGFCFLNVINLNVSSLRIRIIREIYRQRPLAVQDAAITAKYRVSDMLDARLLRLESGGQLHQVSGRYYLRRGAVVHIAHFFASLRGLLFGDKA